MTERDSGGDPLGDLQRWLMRTGARSVTKDLTSRTRRALGQDQTKADVWDTATTRPLLEDEAPECAWCPVCRAARRLRESRQGSSPGAGSGLGSQLAGAGDALASVVQEAYSAFESAMKAPPASDGRGTSGPDGRGTSGPDGRGTSGPDRRGTSGPDGRGRSGPAGSGPSRTRPADPWEDASRDPDDRR